MRIIGLTVDPFNNSPIVILKDRELVDKTTQDEERMEASEQEEDPIVSEQPVASSEDTGQQMEDTQEQFIDLQKDLARERILPIWIGPMEAQAIATELLGIAAPRPMTHDLLKSTIQAMGGEVKRIIVTNLKDNTFYAAIEITTTTEGRHDILTIDSRPSDAIALAVRFNAGIFVEAKVLEKTYNRETTTPSLDEQEINEFSSEKWTELLEQLSAQSTKKYKQ